MIDAKISFAEVHVVAPTRAKRLPPLVGLGMGAIISMSLWGFVTLAVSRIL